MKKLFCHAVVLLTTLSGISAAYADLQALDNQSLQNIDGQSAATIDWLLSLNQKVDPTNSNNYIFDNSGCTDITYCRFGISFNNRFANGAYIDRNGNYYTAAGTATTATAFGGLKQWIVFKGIQGTIHLQNVDIDGTDIAYKDSSGNNQIKAALQLSFNASSPIQIRNLGFDALSIETDSKIESDSTNTPGYLAKGTSGTGIYTIKNGRYDYSNTGLAGYTNTSFDHGRESGFTGLRMNANVAMQGTLKVFSCAADMGRCS